METGEQGQGLHISLAYDVNEMISKAEKVNSVRQMSAQVTVQILLTPKDSLIL